MSRLRFLSFPHRGASTEWSGRARSVLTLVVGSLAILACGAAAESGSGSDTQTVVPDSASSVTATATAPPSSSSTVISGSPGSTQPVVRDPTPPTTALERTTVPVTTTSAPTTTLALNGTETTSAPFTGAVLSPTGGREQVVALRFESWVDDVPVEALRDEALRILNDPRGWPQAGFSFVEDAASPFRVVLAEGPDVDALCLPLRTFGTVSCQNGPVVALNAERWRTAVEHWDAEVSDYRGYLVNHEVGHLLGQRHPKPRCPVAGRPAGVMEQQTAGFEGCIGNAWPRPWEVALAEERPVIWAPLPDWGPEPGPANGER